MKLHFVCWHELDVVYTAKAAVDVCVTVLFIDLRDLVWLKCVDICPFLPAVSWVAQKEWGVLAGSLTGLGQGLLSAV